MTVSNLTSRTSAVGTGAAQTVTFAFPITANAEIVVYTRVTDPLVGAPSPLSEAEEAALLATDGDEATLAEGTHYSVTISGEAGGSITTLSPYVAASKTVYIVRATTQTQDLDLAQGGAFGPAAIEAALDRMAKSIIDIRGQLSRCLSLSVTDDADSGVMLPSAPQRANMSLGFGSDGGVSVVAGVVPTDVTVGAFGSDVVGASTADQVKELLGLNTGDYPAGAFNWYNNTAMTPALPEVTLPTVYAAKGYIDAAISAAAATLPAGTVVAYGGSSAPAGWLLCEGQAVNRTTYSTLFAVVSTTYGSGNGSTTFNVPDLLGRAPIGAGTASGGSVARTQGTKYGEDLHTLAEAELPVHTHSTYKANTTVLQGTSNLVSAPTDTALTKSASLTGATGSGTAFNVTGPSLAVKYIIKT